MTSLLRNIKRMEGRISWLFGEEQENTLECTLKNIKSILQINFSYLLINRLRLNIKLLAKPLDEHIA